MMDIIFFVIGLLVGLLVAYLYMKMQYKTLETREALLVKEKEWGEAAQVELQEKKKEIEQENEALNRQKTALQVELERVNTLLDAEQNHHAKTETMRNEQFAEQLKTVQEQFSNLATRILTQTSQQLQTANNESVNSITAPLKANIEQLQAAIRATNTETAKTTASLTEQLKMMSEQTQRIDQTASQLTRVIRGDNKQQGNWGERTLTHLLDSQGLKRGIDYDVQETITDDKGNVVIHDDSGKKMIPDVILHYPNHEDVIIDAKMSIDAYYQYTITDDEQQKNRLVEDVVKSIRSQAANLARKDYSRYVKKPRRAIDFVIMFVPNEGALQLALAHSPELWIEAFNKKVFITGPQNLFAILRMIEIAWRQYHQTENEKKVFDLAEELVKRVGDFIKRFEKVGKDIEMLHKDYDEAYNKAWSGRQSVVQKANELIAIGVKEAANAPKLVAEPEIIRNIEDKDDEKE